MSSRLFKVYYSRVLAGFDFYRFCCVRNVSVTGRKIRHGVRGNLTVVTHQMSINIQGGRCSLVARNTAYNMYRYASVKHHGNAGVSCVMTSPVSDFQCLECWAPVSVSKIRTSHDIVILGCKNILRTHRQCFLSSFFKSIAQCFCHRDGAERTPFGGTYNNPAIILASLSFNLDRLILKINVLPLNTEDFALPQTANKRKHVGSIEWMTRTVMKYSFKFGLCKRLDVRFILRWSLYFRHGIRWYNTLSSCMSEGSRKDRECSNSGCLPDSVRQHCLQPVSDNGGVDFSYSIAFQVWLNVIIARSAITCLCRLCIFIRVILYPLIQVRSQERLAFFSISNWPLIGKHFNQLILGTGTARSSTGNLLSATIREQFCYLRIPTAFGFAKNTLPSPLPLFRLFLFLGILLLHRNVKTCSLHKNTISILR